MKMTRLAILLVILFFASFYFTILSTYADDWPQVQHDPQHTGYSPETLGNNFRVAWTHAFQPERIHPQVQAIVYSGAVFVPTESGNVYAFNATIGLQLWKFIAGAPILNSVAADNGKVFFGGLDGAVYAVDAFSGGLLWKQFLAGDRGFYAAPIVAENKVLIGGEDGVFYALDSGNGNVLWRYSIGMPIMQTAAYNNKKVFFGGMDMHVYALNTSPVDPNSILAWKSQQIPGQAFKDFWPVVTQGKVIIRPHARALLPGIEPGMPFGNVTMSWLNQYGPTIAAGNAAQVADVMNSQNAIMSSYQASPNNFTKSLFILDENTGQEAIVVPQWSTQSHGGATTPPCVDKDGYLIVPLNFTGSGWGRMDLSRGRIVDILYDGYDQTQPVIWNNGPSQYPAGFANNDEDNTVSCTANLVLSRHTNDYAFGGAAWNGYFNLATRRWTGLSQGWRNGQMRSNMQSAVPNPFAVSNGMIYDTVFHELVARTTN